MAQQKRKSKVKKAHAAKKKAGIVRALKRHAPKARPQKKQLLRTKQPERARKLVAVAKAPVAKGARARGKGKGAPQDRQGKAAGA